MHGIRTIREINESAVKTFEEEQAIHTANLAAAEKVNSLRKAAMAKLLSKPDEELISLVEGATLSGKFLPSTLEEALARRLCEVIGRRFIVENEDTETVG